MRTGAGDDMMGGWMGMCASDADWVTCLTAAGELEAHRGGLFVRLASGRPAAVSGVALCGLEQAGDMVFAPRWEHSLASLPPDSDLRFRVVFLGRCAEMPPDAVADPRVAIAAPAPATEAALALAGDYAKAPAERRPDLLSRLLEAQRQAYRAGVIHAGEGLRVVAAELFAEDDAEAWARAVGAAVVRHVYHRLPSLLPPHGFGADCVLRREDIPSLFEAFLRPESLEPADRARLKPFALGLNLCRRDKMWEAQAESSPICALIREWVGEDQVAARTVYARLTQPPYGLPEDLVTLHLLLLVARPRPAVHIGLRPDHGLTTVSAEPFPAECVRRDSVRCLAWPTGARRAFRSIEAVASSWEPALPFVRLVAPDIDARDDEAWRCRRLASGLDALRGRVRAVRAAVMERLAAATGVKVPPELSAACDALDTVAQASDPADLLRRAQDALGSPPELERALRWLSEAEQYADMADELAAMRALLDAVSVSSAFAELQATHGLLREQLSPGGALPNPNACRGLLARFRTFRQEYRRRYERHHREVNGSHRSLRRELETATPMLDALQRLDRIEELGVPSAVGFYERQQDLLRRTRVCLEREPLSEADAVACPQCGLSLAQSAPTEDVRSFLNGLESAYYARAAALGRALTAQVIAQEGADELRALHDALQLSHLQDLGGILTDELVQHIRSLLRAQPSPLVANEVFERVARQFPIVGEEEVEEVTATFRRALTEALAQARSAHRGGDAKVRLAPPAQP